MLQWEMWPAGYHWVDQQENLWEAMIVTCFVLLWLVDVGGLEHEFLVPIILGMINPTDQYFSEGVKPSTRLLHAFTCSYDETLGSEVPL